MPVSYVGIESLQASERIFLETRDMAKSARNPFIVVDESLKIKNFGTKRTKRILELGKMAQYKLILNGTPISKNLLDIWPQMEFLSPKILNMTLEQFRNTFCETTQVRHCSGSSTSSREFISGYANIEYLYSLIRHYVYECNLNLNISQQYGTVRYEIDKPALARYRQIKDFFLSDDTLEWRNNNIFIEMTTKLQHSYCSCKAKIDSVRRLFSDIPEDRTVIFCKFVDSQKACRKHFPKATVLSYQKEAFGLNMQRFNHTVYFDKIWDYALRVQSKRRTFRTGQMQDCLYFDITGNAGLEHLIDRNISRKVSMSEYFKKVSKRQLLLDL